jgi:acyl-CoA dehydrogenase
LTLNRVAVLAAEIAMIKVAVPNKVCRLDRAIQAHGAAGVTEDLGLAATYAEARVTPSRKYN